MKLLRGSGPFEELKYGAVVTIGNFDGVHRGHQALLAELRQAAKRCNLPTLVVFFEPQPSEYFQTRAVALRLNTCLEKIHYLAKSHIDYVYCLNFNEKLASLSPEAFAERFIFSLFHAKYILIGEDFRFGQGRLGTPKLLETIACSHQSQVEIFKDFVYKGLRVSSTQVRQALKQGHLDYVTELLGRPYAMMGRVIHGKQRARAWGIPTANIHLKQRPLLLSGVFLVRVRRHASPENRTYWGVANLGCRPTVDGLTTILEVHVFDFSDSLYNERLEVFFIKHLREERKFSSVDALITQIHEDRKQAYASCNDLKIEQDE